MYEYYYFGTYTKGGQRFFVMGFLLANTWKVRVMFPSADITWAAAMDCADENMTCMPEGSALDPVAVEAWLLSNSYIKE